MKTSDAILALRQSLGLSQDAFAQQLLVTRQAVSRWENGETVPNTDTLKLMAEAFEVSVDYLLGSPAQCQSCGMLMQQDSDKGTGRDGRKTEEYCAFCYQQGQLRQSTMEEMIEHNLQDLAEWNKAAGLQLTEQEARMQLRQFLPTLKRWQTG